jgi:hypothetical protein
LSDFRYWCLFVFRTFFSRNRGPLHAARPSRVKHYASRSGYQYEYWYAGHRSYRSRTDSGTEFVFRISGDRKSSPTVTVALSTDVLRDWEQSHGREFSVSERYAIAKMALFQAFDERAGPGEMAEAVHVRALDLDAIVAMLNIE